MTEQALTPSELVAAFLTAAETHAQVYTGRSAKSKARIAALREQSKVMVNTLGEILLLDGPARRESLVTIFETRRDKLASLDPKDFRTGTNIQNTIVGLRRYAQQTRAQQAY